jgi:hypothetical protein
MQQHQHPKHLKQIVKELSHSSMRADQIATRLASYSSLDSPVETVGVLQREVTALNEEITRLKFLVETLQDYSSDSAYEELTDEQEATFLKSMRVIVDKLSWVEMTFGYSPQTLASYPKNLRYLVALSLVNSCTVRDLPPEPFWQELVTKLGVM